MLPIWVRGNRMRVDRVTDGHVSWAWAGKRKPRTLLVSSCTVTLILQQSSNHKQKMNITNIPQLPSGTLYHSISAAVTLLLLLNVDWRHSFLIKPLPSSDCISVPTNSILLHMAHSKFYFLTYLRKWKNNNNEIHRNDTYVDCWLTPISSHFWRKRVNKYWSVSVTSWSSLDPRSHVWPAVNNDHSQSINRLPHLIECAITVKVDS